MMAGFCGSPHQLKRHWCFLSVSKLSGSASAKRERESEREREREREREKRVERGRA